ncbi:MAG: DUF4957 domain-containing protein, partial [Eudoraea sp.]|nr:DUF4957 domain-containing protein [Eudoraea sp.]
ADGVTFKANVINNKNVAFKSFQGLEAKSFDLSEYGENIFMPSTRIDVEPYQGFGFETISMDLFGNSRENNNVGAVVTTETKDPMILDKSKYGTSWYPNELEGKESRTIVATNKTDDLEAKIREAENGDIITLSPGIYTLNKSLAISKSITIQSQGEKAEILFSGSEDTPAFELHPKGFLTLNKVILKGNKSQYAFASLRENMSHHFGLAVSDCDIAEFKYVLKVYKESFAERITFENTAISNCENGIELSEETNDKGDYNTEYLTVNNCQFTHVKSNVIDYYRGGYDESTIGGNLLVKNSTFTNCGANEKNRILLNHRGIINVNITENTFKNNDVQFVAILWGAKNNVESENSLTNSGQIKTEENLKLKLMY